MNRRDDLYARARRALAQGDAASWDAAEAMAELADRGETQRDIAAHVGCSVATVNRYIAVFRVSGGNKKRPSFTEAMADIRPGNLGSRVPKSPEKQAELAAKLLRDKRVADAPEVRKAQEQATERRHRAAEQEFREELGISSRTEKEHEGRRTSVVVNSSFWFKALSDIKAATRSLNDAAAEVDRTGLPRSGSGEIIKATRSLAKAAERFAETAAEAGIGKAM